MGSGLLSEGSLDSRLGLVPAPNIGGDSVTTKKEMLVNLWVAQKLEDLAVQVRAGHLTSLEFNWQGGEDFDLKFTPIHPLTFISIPLVVDAKETPE